MDVEFYETGTGPGGSDKLLGEWNDTTHVPRIGELVRMPFSMDQHRKAVLRVDDICWCSDGNTVSAFMIDPDASPSAVWPTWRAQRAKDDS